MKTTVNFGLNLPESTDYADIEKLNENARKLDTAVASGGSARKDTPADGDSVVLLDSAAGNVQKRLLWSRVKALFAPLSHASRHAAAGADPITIATSQVTGLDTALANKAEFATLSKHTASKSNPHGVTAAQVGAAAAVHNHAASQINSGVLPVARGGTGRGNLAELLNDLCGIGGVRIKCGSYVGTGLSESDHPNTLTFGFTPKVVIVYRKDSGGITAGNPSYGGAVLINGVSKYAISNYPGDSGYGGYIHVTWNTNSLSWYILAAFGDSGSESAEKQLNSSGAEYLYAAFG